MPAVERQKKLGALLEGPAGNDKKLAPPKGALLSGYDWRSVNRKNWVTSVKDQAQCGSCWAFGATAALESWWLIKNNTPDPVGNTDAINLSEQELVSCSLRSNGCDGGYLYYTYDFFQSDGIPPESCFAYQALDLPCEQRCPNWQIQAIKIGGWSAVSQDVNSLKAAILQHPLAAGFDVYTDFWYYRRGVYKHVSGVREGGHAICIVGWDDRKQCFIVKNSWGAQWGESGYFRIAYSEVTSLVVFGRNAGVFTANPPAAPSRIGAAVLWGLLKTVE